MLITKIVHQKRKKDFYSIYIDGNYFFSVSDENLLKMRLQEGDHVTPEKLDEIIKEEEKIRAMGSAWRLLNIRSRSRQELSDRLKQKMFSGAAIEHVIQKLSELGYLDDTKFAVNGCIS